MITDRGLESRVHTYYLVQLDLWQEVRDIHYVKDGGQRLVESLCLDTGRVGPVLGYVYNNQGALTIHVFGILQVGFPC